VEERAAALRRWKDQWALWVFAALLGASALLFYGGNIGRWQDDYFFLTQFDRADASMPVRSRVLADELHFWRPLYRYAYTPIVVALYPHPWALHVFSACCHAGVCLGLWAFLRRLGAGRTSSAIAALGFMVYPADFEGAFWASCTPTPIATGMMLGALWMQVRWTERVDSGDARRVGLVVGPAALAFAACCLNEQPAFLVLAMPLAIWCAPRSMEKRGLGRWVRLAVPIVLAMGAVVAYSMISRRMYTQPVGTDYGNIVALTSLPTRARLFFSEILARHELSHFAKGAWREGRHAIAESPVLAAALGLPLVVAGLVWALRGGRLERVCEPRRPENGARGLALVALGMGVFLAAWGPLTFIVYGANPRLAYAPSLGLAIALAGVLEIVFKRARRPSVGAAARLVAVPLLLLGAVMMIGIQHAYRSRWLADERQGEALIRLVPELKGAARPVFIPVRVADRSARTGAETFDLYFFNPLLSPWSAGWWLQLHLKSNDVTCVQGMYDGLRRLKKPAVGWISDRRVRTWRGAVPPAKLGLRRFDIDRILPFEVDEDGEIRIFTHIAVRDDAGVGEERLLPMAAEAFAKGRAPKRVLVAPRVVEDGSVGE
jgi:hypothetical protein